jgi:vacuolar-type H+-ATPase subunit I/STV1
MEIQQNVAGESLTEQETVESKMIPGVQGFNTYKKIRYTIFLGVYGVSMGLFLYFVNYVRIIGIGSYNDGSIISTAGDSLVIFSGMLILVLFYLNNIFLNYIKTRGSFTFLRSVVFFLYLCLFLYFSLYSFYAMRSLTRGGFDDALIVIIVLCLPILVAMSSLQFSYFLRFSKREDWEGLKFFPQFFFYMSLSLISLFLL